MRTPPSDQDAMNLDPIVEQHLRYSGGKALPTLRNLVVVLSLDPRWTDRLSWSTLDRTVYVEDRRVTDRDLLATSIWVDEVYGIRVGMRVVDSAITLIAGERSFHPVADWLRKDPHDGVARIDTFLSTYFGAPDTPLVRRIGAAWLIGAVARAIQPGCVNDAMLLLVSSQEREVVEGLAALAPRPEWFRELTGREVVRDPGEGLAGAWICTIRGIDGLPGGVPQSTASLATTAVDRGRALRAGRRVDLPRQSALVAVTGVDELFQPPAVARHLWPVRVGAPQVAAIHKDAPQIFSEAFARYRAGEPWHLSGPYAGLLGDAQREFASVDPWDLPLSAWAAHQHHPFTLEAALGTGLGLPTARWTDAVRARVGRVLTRLGYEQTRPRSSQKRRPRRWEASGEQPESVSSALVPTQS